MLDLRSGDGAWRAVNQAAIGLGLWKRVLFAADARHAPPPRAVAPYGVQPERASRREPPRRWSAGRLPPDGFTGRPGRRA